jgi:IS5 family transposase
VRWRVIEFTRGRPPRAQRYRELIKITRTTLADLRRAAAQLGRAANPLVALWPRQVRPEEPLIEPIITQTERRMLASEPVPAGEKVVSRFEPHADLSVKGSRDVDYGHKLSLTAGKSGLISTSSAKPAIRRTANGSCPCWSATSRFGAPRPAGSGRWWLRQPRPSRRGQGPRCRGYGLPQEGWPQDRRHGPEPLGVRTLRNFRAGVEAGISCLKRAYGLARCTWRRLDHFTAYVWSAVVASNLAPFARLRSA